MASNGLTPDPRVQQLVELRHALLRLHKILLDSERRSYEQERGTIATSGQFLQLVLHDDWFAWLRPISQLVVKIDQALDEKEPMSSDTALGFVKHARTLIKQPEPSARFTQRYQEALQRDMNVVLAHAEVSRLLEWQM